MSATRALDLGFIRAAQAEPLRQFVEDGVVTNWCSGFWKTKPIASCKVATRCAARVDAVDHDVTARGRRHTRQSLHQSRLAGTVRADDREEFSDPDIEVDVLEHHVSTAPDGQVADPDDGLRGVWSPRMTATPLRSGHRVGSRRRRLERAA